MSKKKKNSQPVQESDSGKGLKRKVVTAIRWAAWILVLCLLLTQLTGNAPGDLATLGQFVIAGLLYAISVVLEQKYKRKRTLRSRKKRVLRCIFAGSVVG